MPKPTELALGPVQGQRSGQTANAQANRASAHIPSLSPSDSISGLVEKFIRLTNSEVSRRQTERDWRRYADSHSDMELSWSWAICPRDEAAVWQSG